MFQSAARAAPRRILVSKLATKPISTRRFLSTVPPSQKQRSWKSSAARWAVAIGGVYYYNTSSIFAEQPDKAISRLDQSLHQIQEPKLPTFEVIAEEKRQRLAEGQAREAPISPEDQQIEDASHPKNHGGSVEDLEEEADQQGAFNPETGEINWDCPCLGGMAHGPCGEEFKAAFSCFVYSKEEPKGMECIDKFKGMQDCFRQHPEMYGSELEDDEDEVEDELRANVSASEPNRSSEALSTAPSQSKSSMVTSQKDSKELKPANDNSMIVNADRSGTTGDEGSKLVPKDVHDDPLQSNRGKNIG